MVDPWKTLGIAQTDDVRQVKKAYAARLKRANPEDDPAGFQQLRKAYELALEYARWHKAHRGSPATPAPSPGPPPQPRQARPPAAAPALPLVGGKLQAHLRKFESQCAIEAAGWLMAEVEKLHDDPSRFGSQAAWRSLLDNECLWNVDTRQRFGGSLVELLARNRLLLPPAIWCLLELEFRWSDQSFAFDRALPRDAVDWVLERLSEAPLESARQLIADGRPLDAAALLEPIASGSDARAPAARALLERSNSARTADRLMRAVERLRADDGAWMDAARWRALLAHQELKKYEIRCIFRKALLDYLMRHGEGLTGAVWRTLDQEFDWSKNLPTDELALVASKLGPAILEHIESLFSEGEHKAVIQRWGLVAGRLDAAAGARARLVVDCSAAALLGRAEVLAAEGQPGMAVADARFLLALPHGELRERAKELIRRCLVELVDMGERLFDAGRDGVVVAWVEPVVGDLEGPLLVRARMLLSRSHLRLGAPAKAVAHLEELLRREPRDVAALSLMAIAHHAQGRTALAASVYRKILWIDPANDHAARELEAIREKEARPAAPRPGQPAISVAPSHDSSAFNGYSSASLILMMAGLSSLRSLAEGGLDPQALVVVKIVAVTSIVGALFAFLLMLDRREGPLSLGLHLSSPGPHPAPDPRKRRRLAYLKATLAISVAVALAAIWWAATG